MKEIILAARKLINTREKWTQGAVARNRLGNSCEVTSDEATCFCAIGDRELTLITYNQFYKHIGPVSLINYNDKHTHGEVLELFDAVLSDTYSDL